MPADIGTIQAAIDMASNGDTVNVAPGRYLGLVNFHGKGVTVQGSAPGVVFSAPGQVVVFHSGESRTAVLKNVTVDGEADSYAGASAAAISIDTASPTIVGNSIKNERGCGIGVISGAQVIANNTISGVSTTRIDDGCLPSSALLYGAAGAIVLYGSSSTSLDALILGNVISDNHVQLFGAGISVFSAGRPTIMNNVLHDNSSADQSGGMVISGDTAALVTQNLIYGNTITSALIVPTRSSVGAGLNIGINKGKFGSQPTWIVNNTIVNNTLLVTPESFSGGSQVFVTVQTAQLYFINNIIVGTGTQSVLDCLAYPTEPSPPPVFNHNDVFRAGGGGAVYSNACSDQTGISGNISAEPLFATGPTDLHPYQLSLASPSVDAGDNQAFGLPAYDLLGQPRIQDARGSGSALVDLGVYEYTGVPASIPAPTDFSVAATPSTVTLQGGGSGQSAVTVTPRSGVLGTVQLSCLGLPASVTCSFKPSSLTFGGASNLAQSVTLTLASSASSRAAGQPRTSSNAPYLFAACLLCPILCSFGKSRIFIRLFALGGILLSALGCGAIRFNTSSITAHN